MSHEKTSSPVLSSEKAQISTPEEASSSRAVNRRSFMKKSVVAGAVAAGAGLIANSMPAFAQPTSSSSNSLSKGDIAILRFLAAAELIESDLWEQYAELGGVTAGTQNPYQLALQQLDGDGSQYISSNTLDEMSHAAFLNAYLKLKGAPPVNLNPFRTLPSSQATGAKQIGRLTNLTQLTVDTSWYTRYRSTKNPDLAGGTFPQAVKITNQPTIPLDDKDTPPNQSQPVPPATSQQQRMQAIANAAGFHFATFDQAGSSVYTNLILNVSDPEVLRVLVSILGVEVNHFAVWHDKAGNAVSQPLAGVKDPETGVTFPDLNASPFGGEQFQTNLIFPEPCAFINPGFPDCAVIRPSLKQNAGAVATAEAIVDSQLFLGQSQAFFNAVTTLAMAADAARRGHSGDD
jgi:hypothetical protein